MKLRRWLFLAHRYLGIALGLLMLVWCLSGVVMMYVRYPALTEDERLTHLAALDWSGCCAGAEDLADDSVVERFQLEMLADRPVLDVRLQDGPARRIDLRSGRRIAAIDDAEAKRIAGQYGMPAAIESLDLDQWTVSGEFRSDRPLWHAALAGPDQQELYVSSNTGKAVQRTTGRERFWNWLGAVPHWLYFTPLRRNAAIWSQIVIWTSLLGSVLAAIGLYLGLTRFGRRPDGRWSPYRGLLFWHHLPGLVFGLFTLTWVASGLVSMNPWGFLDETGDDEERAQLQGQPLSGAQVKAAITGLASADLSPQTVSIRAAPFDGALFLIATARDGTRHRLDHAGRPVPPPDLARAAERLGGGDGVLLAEEDAYYFSHHDPVQLPIYRLTRPDVQQTRFYVDPLSAEIVRKVDADSRDYRWLHEGLHRLDFSAGLRTRPVWDVVMLVLMSGVTAVCGTGAYLGMRRLLRAAVRDSGGPK